MVGFGLWRICYGDLLRPLALSSYNAWFLAPSVQDKYGEEEKASSSESASSEEEVGRRYAANLRGK